ncbi:MAG: hypothetical protein ACFFCS_24115 [Candidatus Hodarchaeota archaeon]
MISQTSNRVSKQVSYVAAVFMVYSTLEVLHKFVFPTYYHLTFSYGGGGTLTWQYYLEAVLETLDYMSSPSFFIYQIMYYLTDLLSLIVPAIAFSYILAKKAKNNVDRVIPSHGVLISTYFILAVTLMDVIGNIGSYIRYIGYELDADLLAELLIGTLPFQITFLAVSIIQVLLVNKKSYYDNFRRVIKEGDSGVSCETI